MKTPMYSNTGYRFRYNYFDRVDGYLLPDNDADTFFDVFAYNTDIFEHPPKENPDMIAEMYFRLQVD